MQEIFYRKKLINKEKEIRLYKKKIKLLNEQLEFYKKQACTDSLTNLNNRRSIENVENFDSIILGDIDHFKIINDKYGHNLGDKVLIEISNILKKYIRDTDLVCRWGGEEFVILLKNCNDMCAYHKAVALKENISKLSDKFGFKITMSFGVSSMLGKTLQTAIEEADIAMYKSKKDGRDKVTVYTLNLQ